MITQTLAQLEAEFRYLADAQGLATAQGRHPSTDLRRLFNASYRRLRDYILGCGYTLFLERGTTTALPTTPVEANERYAVISTAVGVNQIKALDILISPDDWRQLPECTFLQLREMTRRWRGVADTPRRPRAWCWLQAGTVSGSTFTGGQIAIAPVPTQGSYALWTMPEWTDITADADVFLFANEDWKQWLIYDAMAQVVGARDKNNARKLDFIMSRLDPNSPGSPAYNIRTHAPTAAGPRTWVRGADYHSPNSWR